MAESIATLVTIALGVAAVIGLVLLLRRNFLDIATRDAFWLVLATGLTGLAPYVISSLTDGRIQRLSTSREVYYEYSALTELVRQVSSGVLLMIGMFIVVRRISLKRVIGGPAFFALGIWSTTTVATVVAGNLPRTSGWTLGVVLVACLLGSASDTAVESAVAAIAAALVVSTGLVVLFQPETGLSACNLSHKCGPLGLNIFGPLGNENALGLSLAVAFPLTWMATKGWERVLLAGSTASLTVLTGSRTSLATVAVTLVVAILATRERPRAGHWTAWASTLPRVAAGFALAASAAPLFFQFGDDVATERGRLWSLAKTLIPDSPFIGYGGMEWRNIREETGLISRESVYSTHNQWVELAFTSGIVGLSLFLVLVWLRVFGNRSARARLSGSLALLALSICSITERPMNFAEVDTMSFAMLALICSGVAVRTEPSEGVAAPVTKGDISHQPSRTFSREPVAS